MEKEVSEESRSDADENSVDEFEQEFLKQQKKTRLRNLVFLFLFILGLAAGGFLSWFRSGLAVRVSETEIAETREPDFLILDKAPDFTLRQSVKKPAETVVAKAVTKKKKKPKPQPIAQPAKIKPVATKAVKQASLIKKPPAVKKAVVKVVAKAVAEKKKKPQPQPAAKPAKIKPVSPVAVKQASLIKKPPVVKKAVANVVAKAVAEKNKKPKPQPVAKPAKIKPAATKAVKQASLIKKPPVVKKAAKPAVAKAGPKAVKQKPATKEKRVALAKTSVKIAEQEKPHVKKALVSGKAATSYYLQIGIFSKKKYAQKMGNSLKSLGLNPSYREMTISVTGYSVTAGPYASREEADEVVKLVAQKGYGVKAVKGAAGAYRLDFGKFQSGKEAAEATSGLGELGIKAQVEKAKKKLPATMVVVAGINGEDELDKVKKILNSKKVQFFVKKSPR